MAFGLPSQEEMRDYLISKGMDPADAEARAAQAARTNTRQALTTMGTQGAGALVEGAGAAAGSNLLQRAMQTIRGLDTAGTKQLMRTSTGQMRNVAANAPTVIRTAEGQIIKLAPGQAVPAGATVLNVAEAPVASIIGGGAIAAGTPVALASQRGEKGEAPAVPTQDSGMMYDPASGVTMGTSIYDNPVVARAMQVTTPPAATTSTAPAPVVTPPPDDSSEEAGEPGFYGKQGQILQDALNASRAAPAAVVQPNRPAPRAQNAGPAQTAQKAQEPWYSRFMPSDPYAGMSAAKLMERANANPDDAAAFFRADAALRKERPEMFERKQEEGMAHGGAAGGKHHKDAVVMKALEIIHHMLRTR